eukprot:SAG25_NODE_562_length_6909_cov_2.841557_1_plen_41_part_10
MLTESVSPECVFPEHSGAPPPRAARSLIARTGEVAPLDAAD